MEKKRCFRMVTRKNGARLHHAVGPLFSADSCSHFLHLRRNSTEEMQKCEAVKVLFYIKLDSSKNKRAASSLHPIPTQFLLQLEKSHPTGVRGDRKLGEGDYIDMREKRKHNAMEVMLTKRDSRVQGG